VPYDPTHPFTWKAGEIKLDALAQVQELRAFPWIEWNAKGSVDGSLGGAHHARRHVARSVRLGHGAKATACCGSRGPVRGCPANCRSIPAELSARVLLDGGVALERFELHGGERLSVTLEGQPLRARRPACDRRNSSERRGATRVARRARPLAHREPRLLSQLLPGVRRAAGRSDGEVSLRGRWGGAAGPGLAARRA
jgi:hypothetical protein